MLLFQLGATVVSQLKGCGSFSNMNFKMLRVKNFISSLKNQATIILICSDLLPLFEFYTDLH